MNAITTNAPKQRKPRAKPARSIRILEQPSEDTCGWCAVALTVGKQTDTYLLHTVPCEFGNGAIGFEVEKLDANFNPAETYHVLLNGEESTCDCRGFERWSHCKHKDGLETLVKLGKLSGKQFRSLGDMARHDPEAYRQYAIDTEAIGTPNPTHRYQGQDDDLPPAA